MNTLSERPLRVALAHDWLTGMRGGERVLEVLCRMFPNAPIYTLFCNPAALSETIRGRRIHCSWLQHLPCITRYYRNLLPLFPAAARSLRLAPVDLVISTSHCVAKAVVPPVGARHLCYCFTPMRYAWGFFDEYLGVNPLKRALAKPCLAALRRWDVCANQHVDCFATLSRHVQSRIQRFYNRAAEIIYPPVNTAFWTPADAAPACGYDLIVSALVPYKRLDLAVRAYARLKFPLKIVGTGTEYRKLLAMAAPNVAFLGQVSDENIRELYRHCRLLVFPGEEDFGIVPVEAQACGRPVVAYKRGGALETVVEGTTGVFFDEQTPEALCAAVRCCADRRWDSAAIRRHAEQFSTERFTSAMQSWIARCLSHPAAV